MHALNNVVLVHWQTTGPCGDRRRGLSLHSSPSCRQLASTKFLHCAHHVLPARNAEVPSDEVNTLTLSQRAYRTVAHLTPSTPGNRFELGELLDSVVAPLPADAALLESAEDTGNPHPVGLVGRPARTGAAQGLGVDC